MPGDPSNDPETFEDGTGDGIFGSTASSKTGGTEITIEPSERNLELVTAERVLDRETLINPDIDLDLDRDPDPDIDVDPVVDPDLDVEPDVDVGDVILTDEDDEGDDDE